MLPNLNAPAIDSGPLTAEELSDYIRQRNARAWEDEHGAKLTAAIRAHMQHGAMTGADPLTDSACDVALTAGMTCADIDTPDPMPRLPLWPRFVRALLRWIG